MNRSEIKLLIQLSGQAVNPDLVQSQFSGVSDWNRFFRGVYRNRIEGLVFDNLDRARLYRSLPEEIRAGLESRYEKTAFFVEAGLRASREICRILTKNRIEYLFLRGPAVGFTLYPRPYLRPFADLDLLLRKEDIIAAAATLAEYGYRPENEKIPGGYFLKYHLHLRLINRSSGIPLELHWRLEHPYSLDNVAYPSLFEKRRTALWSGTEIPILSREDQLICLGFHLNKHCPFLADLLGEPDFEALMISGGYLLWLADIDRSARDLTPEEWANVREKANNWHLTCRLAGGLTAARRIYSTPLPSGLASAQKRSGLFRRIFYPRRREILRGKKKGRIDDYLFRPRPGTVFRPIRILDLFGYLFPPPGYIRKKYRPLKILFPFAYSVHTIRGLGMIISNLFAYLRFKLSRRA